MRMKWDTIKEKAILAAVGNVPYCYEQMAPYGLLAGMADGSFDWKKATEELRGQVIKIIEKWDIRRAKTLIDLFPSIVPKKFVGKVPGCYMADNLNGDWMVEFKDEKEFQEG